jgi:hypothetical protein
MAPMAISAKVTSKGPGRKYTTKSETEMNILSTWDF